jgi:hypothetical protein
MKWVSCLQDEDIPEADAHAKDTLKAILPLDCVLSDKETDEGQMLSFKALMTKRPGAGGKETEMV